jgi:NTE family protein
LYGEKKSDIIKEKDTDNTYLGSLTKTFSTLITTGDKYSLGYFSLINSASSAMIHQIAKMTIEKYKPDIVIDIPSDSANTFDFNKAKELIQMGEIAARKAITNFYQVPFIT